MKLIFEVDDKVIIKRKIANVPAGTIGRVFCVYTTATPSYEVVFFESSIEAISIYLEADEIESV